MFGHMKSDSLTLTRYLSNSTRQKPFQTDKTINHHKSITNIISNFTPEWILVRHSVKCVWSVYYILILNIAICMVVKIDIVKLNDSY